MFTSILKKLELLENKVCVLESSLEVSHQVNQVLRKEIDNLTEALDNQEQYSRRSCLVIDGITPNKTESPEQLRDKIMNLTTNHLANQSVHPDDFIFDFDKCHRIGPIKDNKQTVIVKFRSNAFRGKLYKAKKSTPKGIKFRVSLTKRRINLLEHANKKVADIENIKFAYADINGNTKLLLNERTEYGKWTRSFKDEEELDEILSEYRPQHIAPNNGEQPETQTEEHVFGQNTTENV